jgi:hypothetical protein
MRTPSLLISIALLALAACVVTGCSTSSTGPTAVPAYSHPLASAGSNDVYLDGVRYPFATDLDYAEYYEGDDLAEEFGYYTKKGFHSFFNIDLNADSAFIQFMILDVNVTPGVYQIGDTELKGVVRTNYEFHDTISNQDAQKIKGGTLTITAVDIPGRRISGFFSLSVENIATKTPHLIEGSFTEIFYQYGSSGGECGTADISATGITSLFSSTHTYPAFGNAHGQGLNEEMFSVQIATEQSESEGYESLRFSIQKPVRVGKQDILPGAAIYTKYAFDAGSHQYVAVASDTNSVVLPDAIAVTDYDVVRRRISGTFGFTITDNSTNSPIIIANGKFSDLFWW